MEEVSKNIDAPTKDQLYYLKKKEMKKINPSGNVNDLF